MYIKLILLGIFFYFVLLLPVQGQNGLIQSDTLLLEEVTIQSFPLHKYAAGSKIVNIDSATLDRFKGNTLSDLLQHSTPLYLKNYGNGMLSTITIRGTAAGHTAVLWNGVNINSMSLGLSDFSIIPLTSIENINIQYGAGSALYGSDAIGGSINLSSDPSWINGFKGSIQQEIGSFNHYNSSVIARYGNGKWEGKTSILYKNFKNNFPYINTTRIDSPREYQENGSIIQRSLMQDLNYRISNRSLVSIKAWWNGSYREIQPAMTVKSQDHQNDENLKIMGNFHYNLGKSTSLVRAAYLKDIINFNSSESVVERVYTAFHQDIMILPTLEIKAGIDWNHIIANVSGYGSVITENRNDFFVLMRYIPSNKWLLSFNARQPFVTGFNAPFSPSVGAEYLISDLNHTQLKWKINLSRNYRVPTLNDRYWMRGGNRNLLPEESLNAESGFVITHKKGNFTTKTELSAFYYHVENWIAWIPGVSYWSAENLHKVKARGFEILQNTGFTKGEVQIGLNFHYSFTKSTYENPENKFLFGKQLIYTPLHNGNITTELTYKKWFINTAINYTGRRFTTADNTSHLPSFSIVDGLLGRNISRNSFSADVFLRVNNLMDRVYHNYRYFAMPGRNYMASIRFTFN